MHKVQVSTGLAASVTHVILDPLDFVAKLASLVPKPKINLTRFYGVLAPDNKHGIAVTPARHGKGRRKAIEQDKAPEERRTNMTWAQRLK